MKHAVFMWGANVTSSNCTMRFQRTAGAGASTWDATLSTSPGSDVPDFLPIGNGASYDLLKSVKDAMDLQDPNDTYTVSLLTDGTTGRINGKIRIVNDQAHAFTIKHSHANTTINAHWLGGHRAEVFQRTQAPGDDASDASGVLDSQGFSSLMWVTPYPAGLHLYEGSPRAITRTMRTLSGRSSSRRLAVRSPSGWLTLADQIAQKATTANQDGGQIAFEADGLDLQYVHRSVAANYNTSLEVWWDHASQGKWFALFEDEALIRSGSGQTEAMRFCRLLDQDAQEDYDRIVTQQSQPSPRLFDVRMTLDCIDINHLSAGGA